MTTKKSHRRKGIATHLLQACEDLVLRMKARRQIYLHCRVVDKCPFTLYTKAGYKAVKRNSVMVWLTLQRRKYLMCKILPMSNYDRMIRTKDLSPANDTLPDVKSECLPSPNDGHPDVKSKYLLPPNDRHRDVKSEYLLPPNGRHQDVKPEDLPQQYDSHL